MLEPDIEKLIDAARAVQGAFALEEPDFSAASVGAALRTTSGAIYTGVCIDLACGIGFCAEHAAIAEMLKHREVEIDAIVAVNNSWILPPCGRCRELIAQISPRNADTQVILPGERVVTLRELLPEHWLSP
ncbi:MAG: cytidine deaminase family protein [Planctomycetota bacterium]|jgi:cytidine deaminase